jgi:hypothetical protein
LIIWAKLRVTMIIGQPEHLYDNEIANRVTLNMEHNEARRLKTWDLSFTDFRR